MQVRVGLALGAVLWSLVSGISAMAVNGQIAHHDSTHWMIRRVAFQAAALALVLLAVLS